MTRINVYTYAFEDPQFVGWFDIDSATEYEEEEVNGRSINPVPQYSHQSLYRTAQGRWVLCTWSRYSGTTPRYEFVTSPRAREWLLHNYCDEGVRRWFGEIADEQGPG